MKSYINGFCNIIAITKLKNLNNCSPNNETFADLRHINFLQFHARISIFVSFFYRHSGGVVVKEEKLAKLSKRENAIPSKKQLKQTTGLNVRKMLLSFSTELVLYIKIQ